MSLEHDASNVWDLPFDFEAARTAGYEGTEVDAWIDLGCYLAEKGRTQDGLKALAHAASLAPEYSRSHYHIGDLCLRTGRYPEAVESLQRAAGIIPDHWVVWYKLGQAYARLGEHDKGLASFTTATDLNPTAAPAFVARAECFAAIGDYERAVSDLDVAIEINPAAGKWRRFREALATSTGEASGLGGSDPRRHP